MEKGQNFICIIQLGRVGSIEFHERIRFEKIGSEKLGTMRSAQRSVARPLAWVWLG